MTNFNSAINDDDLDHVSGGMDSKTTIAVAHTYLLASQALSALGNSAGSAAFAGRAGGVIEASGGCPK